MNFVPFSIVTVEPSPPVVIPWCAALTKIIVKVMIMPIIVATDATQKIKLIHGKWSDRAWGTLT